jgi:hypothetical protein
VPYTARPSLSRVHLNLLSNQALLEWLRSWVFAPPNAGFVLSALTAAMAFEPFCFSSVYETPFELQE